jgi:ABC-type transporter Mla subunit MlaD
MDTLKIVQLVATLVPLAAKLAETLAKTHDEATHSQADTMIKTLQAVQNVTPELESIIRVLDSDAANAALRVVQAVTPAAAQLVATLDAIHDQTADEYAAVWAPIRDDWKKTVATWNGTHFQTR